MTTQTQQREEYQITVPITVKVWAFNEADALRQVVQGFSTGFPLVTKVKKVNGPISREAASL